MRDAPGAGHRSSGPGERFDIDGSRTVRTSGHDDVAVAAAGITLHEALRAVGLLADEGIYAHVIDLYSVKAVDTGTLHAAAKATGGRLVTVEDHRPEGRLGEAVVSSLSGDGDPLRITKLAVTHMPGSGRPEQLLRPAGIDAGAIAQAARALVA
jgi:transketolase